MKPATILLTAGHVVGGRQDTAGTRTALALAIAEHVPPGVRVVDNGDGHTDETWDVSYRLPSGNWLGEDLPAGARDLSPFYTGRDTIVPVTFQINVPDEEDTGAAA